MAKAEPQDTMTADEAAEMERRLAAYRQQQQATAAREARDKAKPLIEFVDSDAFKAFEEAVPMLDPLSVDPAFPNLRVHLDALRHGLVGVRQVVDFLPIDPETAPVAE